MKLDRTLGFRKESVQSLHQRINNQHPRQKEGHECAPGISQSNSRSPVLHRLLYIVNPNVKEDAPSSSTGTRGLFLEGGGGGS
mmetsp:Transcript_5970/g.9961  ORF Transcript_5970/g.9961 Transcript_5970/m.9961 type:complete len:83 (-) Transcript_5970:1751-1999(-)